MAAAQNEGGDGNARPYAAYRRLGRPQGDGAA